MKVCWFGTTVAFNKMLSCQNFCLRLKIDLPNCSAFWQINYEYLYIYKMHFTRIRVNWSKPPFAYKKLFLNVDVILHKSLGFFRHEFKCWHMGSELLKKGCIYFSGYHSLLLTVYYFKIYLTFFFFVYVGITKLLFRQCLFFLNWNLHFLLIVHRKFQINKVEILVYVCLPVDLSLCLTG